MPDPSLRFTVVSVHGRMRTSRTEYILGCNSRVQHCACHGYGEPGQPDSVRVEYGPARAFIRNLDLRYSFHLDIESRVYTAIRVSDHGSPAWMKTRQQERSQPSGHTIHVHTETIDTGERLQMFGRSARHVLIRTSRVPGSGSHSDPTESETDGWYIDPPAAWLKLHPNQPGVGHVLTGSSSSPGDFKLTFAGDRETGFPLVVTQTTRSTPAGPEGAGKTRVSVRQNEVTELSEDPLDPGFFVPPGDFRRVLRLPGERRGRVHGLRLRWEIMKEYLTGKHW